MDRPRTQGAQRNVFVPRVWRDETGCVWGQIAEPASERASPLPG